MIKSIKDRLRKLLVGGEAYTGTDNVALIRNGFWGSLPFLVGSFVSLGLTVMYANLLSQETYGIYKFIVALGSSIGFLTFTGMNGAVVRSVSKGERGILKFATLVQIRWNMLYFAAAALISGYYFVHHNLQVAIGMLVLGLTFPLTSALNTYGAYLNGVRRFRDVSLIAMISNLFYGASIVVVVILFRTPISLVVAYALGSLIPVTIAYFRTEPLDVGTPTEQGKADVMHIGRHYSFMAALSSISRQIDRLSVFHVQGAAALALFSIAQSVPQRLNGLLGSAVPSILPNLSRRSLEVIRGSFYKRLVQGFVIGTAVTAVYWVTSPFLFRYVLPKYVQSLQYSQWFSVSIIFSLPIIYLGSIFQSQGMIRESYAQMLSGNLARILLLPVLMYWYGIWGLIFGTLAILAASVGLGISLVEWKMWRARML